MGTARPGYLNLPIARPAQRMPLSPLPLLLFYASVATRGASSSKSHPLYDPDGPPFVHDDAWAPVSPHFPSIERSNSDLVVPTAWPFGDKHEIPTLPEARHPMFRAPRRAPLLTVLWPATELSGADWADPALVKGVIQQGRRNTEIIRRNLAILRRHLYKRRIRMGAAHPEPSLQPDPQGQPLPPT